MKADIAKRLEKALRTQSGAVRGIKESLNRNFYKAVNILADRRGKVVVTGIGKSGFIGMKFVATLTSLGHTAVFLHPVEAMHGDSGVVSKGDVVVALSFSGETIEAIKIAKYLQDEFKTPVISITGNRRSSLAKISDAPIVLDIDDEGSPHGLAPMASTTTSLVVCDLLAVGLTDPESFGKHHFAKFHPGGSLGLSLMRVGEFMRKGDDMPIVAKTDRLQKILKTMSEKGRKGIAGVVNSKDKLVGAISDGDLRRSLIKDEISRETEAHEIMTKRPKTIDEDASLKEALATMEKNKITSLFVTNEEGGVCGFIHMHDIIEGNIV